MPRAGQARRRDQRDDRGERSREGTSEAWLPRPSFPTGSSPSCFTDVEGPASSSGTRRCRKPGRASPHRRARSQVSKKRRHRGRSGPGTRFMAGVPLPTRGVRVRPSLHDRLSGDVTFASHRDGHGRGDQGGEGLLRRPVFRASSDRRTRNGGQVLASKRPRCSPRADPKLGSPTWGEGAGRAGGRHRVSRCASNLRPRQVAAPTAAGTTAPGSVCVEVRLVGEVARASSTSPHARAADDGIPVARHFGPNVLVEVTPVRDHRPWRPGPHLASRPPGTTATNPGTRARPGAAAVRAAPQVAAPRRGRAPPAVPARRGTAGGLLPAPRPGRARNCFAAEVSVSAADSAPAGPWNAWRAAANASSLNAASCRSSAASLRARPRFPPQAGRPGEHAARHVPRSPAFPRRIPPTAEENETSWHRDRIVSVRSSGRADSRRNRCRSGAPRSP